MKKWLSVLPHFRFSILSVILTLTAFSILCKLGFWQLERAAQKRHILATQSQQVFDTDSLHHALTNKKTVQLDGQKVSTTVLLNDEYIWLIDNKVYQGKVGYSVVTVGQIESTNHQVLVDLGWWPAPQSRKELPSVSLPKKVLLTGLLKSQNFEQFTLQSPIEGKVFPKRIQSVEPALDYAYDTPVHPIVIYADSNTIVDHPQLYKPVVMPPEKHTAYAVQWFLLAFACVVVFLAASRKKIKVEPTSNKESK